MSLIFIIAYIAAFTYRIDAQSVSNVNIVVDYAEKFITQLRSIDGVSTVSKYTLSVEDVSPNNFKYIQLFNDAVSNNKAIQSSFHSSNISQSDLDRCFNKVNGVTEISLSMCSEDLLDKIYVPSIAANNYLYRLGNIKMETSSNPSSMISEQMQPMLMRLKLGVPTNVLKCPFNLHQVLYVITTESVTNFDVKIRLFSSSSSASFSPHFDYKLSPPSGSSSSSTLSHYDDIFRTHLFNKTGFPQAKGETKTSLPKYVEMKLFDGSVNSDVKKGTHFALKNSTSSSSSTTKYLFIPHNLLTSALVEKNTKANATIDNDTVYVCRICFVDASNYQHFIQLLTTAESIEKNISQKKSNTNNWSYSHLLQLLHQTELAMESNPIDMSFASIQSLYDKNQKTNNHNTHDTLIDNEFYEPETNSKIDQIKDKNNVENKGNLMNNILSGKLKKQQGITTATVNTASTGSVKSSNNNNTSGNNKDDKQKGFKNWQEKQKWNKMITSMTLPQPTQPVIRQLGRRNVTLEWYSSFIPSSQDITTFGFRVDICHLPDDLIFKTENTTTTVHKESIEEENENILNNKAIPSKPILFDITLLDLSESLVMPTLGSSNINAKLKTVLPICRNITVARPSVNIFSITDKLIEVQTSLPKENTEELVTTFGVILGTEVEIQPASMYFTRITTIFDNIFSSISSPWSQVYRTLPLIPPGQLPTLDYIRKLVNAAFGKLKEKNQAEAATSGKLMKRLPKPILINNTVEASHFHMVFNQEHKHSIISLSTSIFLTFPRPGDDGGSPITEYDVYGRTVSCEYYLLHNKEFSDTVSGSSTATVKPCKPGSYSHMPSTWTLYHSTEISQSVLSSLGDTLSHLHNAKTYVARNLGVNIDIVTLQVDNLHIDTYYEFKYCARNSIGCGTMSDISNVFKTLHDDEVTKHTNAQKRINVLLGKNYTSVLVTDKESTEDIKNKNQLINKLNENLFLISMNTQMVATTRSVNITLNSKTISSIHKQSDITDSIVSVWLHDISSKYKMNGWKCHWSPMKLAALAPIVIVGEIYTQKTIYRQILSSTSTHSTTAVTTPSTTPTVTVTLDGDNSANVINGKIVVIQRGGIPIVTKVQKAQRAGAMGVIIVDNGTCKTFDQSCVAGSDKMRGMGFAIQDMPQPWSTVRLPVILVLQEDFDTLMTSSALAVVLGTPIENNTTSTSAAAAAAVGAGVTNKKDEL